MEVIEEHRGKVKKSELIEFLDTYSGFPFDLCDVIADFLEIPTYKYSCGRVDSTREYDLGSIQYADTERVQNSILKRTFEYIDMHRSIRVYKNLEGYPVAVLKHSRFWSQRVSIARVDLSRVSQKGDRYHFDVVSDKPIKGSDDDETPYSEFVRWKVENVSDPYTCIKTK